jgi:hypothetical protein
MRVDLSPPGRGKERTVEIVGKKDYLTVIWSVSARPNRAYAASISMGSTVLHGDRADF